MKELTTNQRENTATLEAIDWFQHQIDSKNGILLSKSEAVQGAVDDTVRIMIAIEIEQMKQAIDRLRQMIINQKFDY